MISTIIVTTSATRVIPFSSLLPCFFIFPFSSVSVPFWTLLYCIGKINEFFLCNKVRLALARPSKARTCISPLFQRLSLRNSFLIMFKMDNFYNISLFYNLILRLIYLTQEAFYDFFFCLFFV